MEAYGGGTEVAMRFRQRQAPVIFTSDNCRFGQFREVRPLSMFCRMQTFIRSEDTPSRRSSARESLVARVESLLHADSDDCLRLARVCRTVGVKERSLRNAFYAVRGMSPKRFELTQRLQHVRHELQNAAVTHATVTQVATDHGFFDLGRFAGKYKAMFGERPSDTLRGSLAHSSPAHAHASSALPRGAAAGLDSKRNRPDSMSAYRRAARAASYEPRVRSDQHRSH